MMIVVTVCVGSSCYLRGAHQIAEILAESIQKHGLQGKIELQGAFCMNRCLEGVAVAVNGHPLPRATTSNASDLFRTYVLREVNDDALHPC